MCVDPMEVARERFIRAMVENPRLVLWGDAEKFLPTPMHRGDMYHEHGPRRKMVEGDLYA